MQGGERPEESHEGRIESIFSRSKALQSTLNLMKGELKVEND